MIIQEFLSQLRAHPTLPLSFRLPDGSWVPAHCHITEVGHVSKRFVDCGGTRRVQESCLLQTWVHDDTEHRLLAGKLATIFERAGDLLPHQELPIEVEHELTVVAQFPLESVQVEDGRFVVNLGTKHTDCLARAICLPGTCAPVPLPTSVCAPVPVSMLVPSDVRMGNCSTFPFPTVAPARSCCS